MVVLYIVTNSSLMDGINRHVLSVTTALRNMKLGITPVVLTLHKRGDLNDELDRIGVGNHALEVRNGHDIRIFSRFARVMSKVQPDIIHYHVLGIIPRLILKLKYHNVRLVTTIHGISRSLTQPTFRNRIERLFVWFFNLKLVGLIYISNGVRKFFDCRSSTIPVIETIYNPLNFNVANNRDSALRQVLGVGFKAKIIGTACRFAWVKNPVAFTSAMASVLAKLPGAHAAILGDGQDEVKVAMRKAIDKFGVGDRFHWLGYRPDAPDLVRGLDCFVMTSHWEGMPTSLLECMAQKVPIAFMEGYGGLKDLVELNSTKGPIATVSASGDVNGLANQIEFLLKNPDRARAIAARAYDVGKNVFDTSVVVPKMAEFYSRVMDVTI